MTDPNLTLALVVAVGMAVCFFEKCLRLERELTAERANGTFWRKRAAELGESLFDTEAALHRKIEAEVTRVGGGKVA